MEIRYLFAPLMMALASPASTDLTSAYHGPIIHVVCPDGTTNCFAGSGNSASVTAPGKAGTTAQAVQGIPGGVPQGVADPNNGPVVDMMPITPGTPFTPGRQVGFVATTSGTITVTLASGRVVPNIPVIVSASLQTLGLSLSNITLGTAVGTFWNEP